MRPMMHPAPSPCCNCGWRHASNSFCANKSCHHYTCRWCAYDDAALPMFWAYCVHCAPIEEQRQLRLATLQQRHNLTFRQHVLRKLSGSSPHCSSTPGRKFSTTMSADFSNWRTRSRPASVFKSREMHFLLRPKLLHQSDVPSFISRQLRIGSPPGGSTLMTSAPK